MKTAIRGFVLLLALALAPACQNDPIQKDLIDYVNFQQQVAPEEKAAASKYADITKGISDMNMMADDLRKNVVDKYKATLEKVKKLDVKTAEVQALASLHVKVLGEYIAAVNQIADGLAKKDLVVMKAGKDGADAADKDMKTYTDKVRELAAQHGVEFRDDVKK